MLSPLGEGDRDSFFYSLLKELCAPLKRELCHAGLRIWPLLGGVFYSEWGLASALGFWQLICGQITCRDFGWKYPSRANVLFTFRMVVGGKDRALD